MVPQVDDTTWFVKLFAVSGAGLCDVGTSSHQVCQPIACSVKPDPVSLGRINLSSPLHTLVLHTQKHVPVLLLVYRLMFHAVSFKVVGHRHYKHPAMQTNLDSVYLQHARCMNLGNTELL